MKIRNLLIIALVIGLSPSTSAFAAQGNLPYDTIDKTLIQNLKALAPTAGKSRCDTVSATSAVQKRYSAAGYVGISAQVYDIHTGAPIVVKWQEDGKQVAVGSTHEVVNNQGKTINYITYVAFTNHTTGSCTRRQ